MRTTLNLCLVPALILYALSTGAQGAGSVVGWGQNTYGECDVPAPNAGFTAVSAGYLHSLGLKTDGSIVAWGNNTWGQCNVPAPNTDFVAVAAGYRHSLGLKADGSVVAWGSNDDDHGTGTNQCIVPLPNEGFVAIGAGAFHSLGLKADGTIVAWGRNREGQGNVPSPNTGFLAIGCGEYHNLAIRTDTSIVAWGYNEYGQCYVPQPNTGFVQADGGWRHSFGLRADGSIVAWGNNGDGCLNIPQPNTGYVSIESGSYHSLAMRANGEVVAWGRNDWGQCDLPSANMAAVAISGGGTHSLALTTEPANSAPVAIGQDVVVAVGPEGCVDASVDGGSYDPEGGLLVYSQDPPGPYGVGVYSVTLTVTDLYGAWDSCQAMVVVYDPSGGFVTGGGWMWSPQGACIAAPALEGKANFGFVSKYRRGATVPTGQTEFVFETGGLDFHSSSYEWLVVNTAGSSAQFKGSGTINGAGDYKFMLWAGDAAPDTFRIKIWQEDGDELVIYDNGFSQPIEGGSIIVHKE